MLARATAGKSHAQRDWRKSQNPQVRDRHPGHPASLNQFVTTTYCQTISLRSPESYLPEAFTNGFKLYEREKPKLPRYRQAVGALLSPLVISPTEKPPVKTSCWPI